MNRPRLWRPWKFAEILGEANVSTVRCLQSEARRRSLLVGFLLGPYGSGKISLARLLMASYCCASPDPNTADPCGRCEGCLRQGPDFNGEFHAFRHWEIDCAGDIGRKEISRVLQEARQEDRAGLFLDELARLGMRSAQYPLLKYSEDLRQGVLLAAAAPDATTGRLDLIPPLFERLPKFHLQLPEVHEMTAFFLSMAPCWGVETKEDVLQEMVFRSQRSFRTCLEILDAASRRQHQRLDSELLNEFLTSGPGEDPQYTLEGG